jgi:hypothetical protein
MFLPPSFCNCCLIRVLVIVLAFFVKTGPFQKVNKTRCVEFYLRHGLKLKEYTILIVFPAGCHLGFHSILVGIWTTAKCIAMLLAHQLMRMCGPIEKKMAAGQEYDE